MAFVWSDDTYVEKEQFDELRTNINTLRTNLQISAWSWSSIPVTKGSYVYPNNPVNEVRNALDDTENQNECHANYVSQLLPYCSLEYTNDKAGNNSGYGGCHGYCVIYWVPNYTTRLATDNVVINGTCTTVNINHNAVVQGSWLHYFNYSNYAGD